MASRIMPAALPHSSWLHTNKAQFVAPPREPRPDPQAPELMSGHQANSVPSVIGSSTPVGAAYLLPLPFTHNLCGLKRG